MNHIEGYVLLFENGPRVKLKTEWYFTLHKVHQSTSDRDIFEAIVNEVSDDLRDKLSTFDDMIDKLNQMELIVFLAYNSMVQSIEKSYITNKDLDCKNYMIKAKKELLSLYFGLTARCYSKNNIDYKKAMESRWE